MLLLTRFVPLASLDVDIWKKNPSKANNAPSLHHSRPQSRCKPMDVSHNTFTARAYQIKHK